MLEAWRPIFNRCDGHAPPDYTQFLNTFPDALPSDTSFDALRPFQIPLIDEHIITAVIKQLTPCAGGVDGWHVHELKALGPLCIQRLVHLYRLIESMNTWPDHLCEIPVAALKKGGCSPLEARPISLSPLLCRVWAKAKFQQLQSWHVSWLPDVLRGGAPQREAVDCYYQVALEAELAQTSNHTLFGVFYDYKKCFDNVSWEIESGLLRDLGMPTSVHGPMLAFSKQIVRRFKFGNSIGPAFPNTDSIMQGCPLAVLRINAVIAAWARSLTCTFPLRALGGYIDDKNVRTQSAQQLQQIIQHTSTFDAAIDAVVNTDKTVTFATSAKGRKQLSHIMLNGQPLNQVNDDKLLGGHMSFTKRRSRAIANKRARKYLDVAERVVICPLNIAAKETMLVTAGAAKYKYGLELGPCDKKRENQLRNNILQALWRGRSAKSVDIALTLCHKGHLFDPLQLRLIQPFIIARRQLRKNPHLRQLWLHIWHDTVDARSRFKDGRSNSVGLLANLQVACNHLQWSWISPFEFQAPVGHGHTVTLNLYQHTDGYFNHMVHLGASRMLWTRAAANRKELRGLHPGVDKVATLKLLSSSRLQEYDRGILRSILACAIYTQQTLYRTRQADHPICPYCWQQEENLERLFWHCSSWQHIRQRFLNPTQLRDALLLPSCALRTEIFIITPRQSAAIVAKHSADVPDGVSIPLHTCSFPTILQKMMVEIVKARKQAETTFPPDDFDPSRFSRPDRRKQTASQKESRPSSQLDANPAASVPSHDELGLLLSTSKRPGGSKYQYVQKVKAIGLFRAVITHKASRQSFGPFQTEVQAAQRV